MRWRWCCPGGRRATQGSLAAGTASITIELAPTGRDHALAAGSSNKSPLRSLSNAELGAELVRYSDLADLRAILKAKDAIFIKASYLVKLAQMPSGVIPRRQDLPADAVVDDTMQDELFSEITDWDAHLSSKCSTTVHHTLMRLSSNSGNVWFMEQRETIWSMGSHTRVETQALAARKLPTRLACVSDRTTALLPCISCTYDNACSAIRCNESWRIATLAI